MNIGVHVPAVTPFDDRGDVDEAVFRQVIENLVAAGVRYTRFFEAARTAIAS